ncbi:MAG: hypothetical protein OEW63_05940 [Gammaproteobacteria bacterium]|nr:hypothetical protein [Gammaproteobacteria bacterium]
MSINKHKYIKLLEYAVAQKSSYYMEPGLLAANMTETEFENIRDSIFINANTQAPPPNKNQVFDWRLKPEAVFGYLTYKQYEHAQQSSKQAIYISAISLAVATLTLVVAGFSIWL